MNDEKIVEKKIEEDFKPRTWLLIVLIVIGLGITVVLVNKVIEDRKAKEAEAKEMINNASNNFFDIFNKAKEAVEEGQKEIEEEKQDFAVESFNNDFEMYSGTQDRFFVIILIDEVITNNKKNSEHLITMVNGDIESSDPEEIRKIKQNITDMTAEYEVIFDYDEDGYVNKITIE